MKTAPALLAVSLLASCTSGPDFQRPTVPLATNWRAAGTTGQNPAQWWRAFGDEVLNTLQIKAAMGNLTIEVALARVAQARALLERTDADRRPVAQIEGSAARVEQSLNSGFGLLSRILPDYPRTLNASRIGIASGWDIDFAGGTRRRQEIAEASVVEAEAGAAAARLAVAADLSDAYWALRGAQARKRQFEALLALEREERSLLEKRVRIGDAAKQLLDAAASQLARLEAGVRPLDADIEVQQSRIIVLLGLSPSPAPALLMAPAAIAEAPDPAIGLPADILSHRPDVVAAEYRLIAANASIGVAMAEYFPKISLSAALGLESSRLTSLATGGSITGFGGIGLKWRLFDFGRIDAEIRVARGRVRENLAAYRAVVLKASEEVETCFGQLAAARGREEQIKRSRDRLNEFLVTSRRAYRLGGISWDALLDHERQLAQVELAVIDARESVVRSITACHRALGEGV